MYVRRLRLRRIRRFNDLELDFTGSDGQCKQRALFIGRNGTCKTTILRCLAIALAEPTDANTLLGERTGNLLARADKPGIIEIEVDPLDSTSSTSTASAYWSLVIKNVRGKETAVQHSGARDQVRPFVCGYGSNRGGTGFTEGQYSVYKSTQTLFQYGAQLIAPELAFRRLQDFLGEGNYVRTLKGIKRAVGLSLADEIRVTQGGGVEVRSKSLGNIPFEGLADGHRVSLNVLIDVYSWALQANRVEADGGIRGVLLIDEVEQHLHPALQKDVMAHLAKVFPHMQVFATTHSPLVALGVKPNECVPLKAGQRYVSAVKNVPDYTSWSAEDLLEDEKLFDVDAYSTAIQAKLDRYQQLVAIPPAKRSARQSNDLRMLAGELSRSQKPVPADDPVAEYLKRLERKIKL